ncbi:MAG: DUF11 domain-containing protein, partial [Glycomyces artemisiae]|nr:DUF11 domain-containing protein [Glycomyces artemisiae]
MRSFGRKAAAAVLALSTGLVTLLVPATAASAQQQDATLTLTKTASAETVQPGETFTYTVVIGCTSFTPSCADATLTDVIPDEFLVQGTPQVTGASGTSTVDGQSVTVVFDQTFSDGTKGLAPGATATVQIQVRVDPDLPHSADGVPVTNNATVAASNADSKSDSAVVTPSVPLELAVDATKSFDPDQGVARPGTATTLTVGATDRSNGDIDSLRITDPADPAATPNPFDYLAFTGFGDVVFPDGADQVLVEV